MEYQVKLCTVVKRNCEEISLAFAQHCKRYELYWTVWKFKIFPHYKLNVRKAIENQKQKKCLGSISSYLYLSDKMETVTPNFKKVIIYVSRTSANYQLNNWATLMPTTHQLTNITIFLVMNIYFNKGQFKKSRFFVPLRYGLNLSHYIPRPS